MDENRQTGRLNNVRAHDNGCIIEVRDVTNKIYYLNLLKTEMSFESHGTGGDILYWRLPVTQEQVSWCKIIHPNDNDALAKLNSPSLLFGTGTDKPYTIIFEDSRGDSDLGGGISVIYGFMYASDNYGTQIAQHYSGTIRKRKKENNIWSDWIIIHD